MKPYAEQIASFEATRAAKVAEREAVQQKAMDEGRTKDEAEQETFKTLTQDIASIDRELIDLRELEKQNVTQAKAVTATNVAEGSDSRDTYRSIAMPETLPKGIGFARAVRVKLLSRLDHRNVMEIAKEMYPSDDRLHKHLQFERNVPQIIMQLKAAVPAATTTSSVWAGALVDPTNLPGEFIEFLRPATIIGRLNLRNVPTNVRMIEQTQGGTGYWVGQGAPKPLTAFGFAPVTLSPTKVAAISVATEESLRYSSPSLDTLIRDSLRDALVERVDRDLLDPAEAGTANVQPASLTNGVTALSSAGTSADNARTDMANLVQALRSANLRGPIAIVLPDSLLTGLMFMVNSLGQPEFPGLDSEGGLYKGIRFITSEYVANQSGGGNLVVAIAEREVFRSDDGGVRVDASDQASLQMLDNPTNNSASANPTTMVSMWQTNSVAFRGEWFINWQKRRDEAVAYIDDVNWASVGSP
jgi:HK97 family phage major capsid protein